MKRKTSILNVLQVHHDVTSFSEIRLQMVLTRNKHEINKQLCVLSLLMIRERHERNRNCAFSLIGLMCLENSMSRIE